VRRPTCKHQAMLQLTRSAAGAWGDLAVRVARSVFDLARYTSRAYARTWAEWHDCSGRRS
jgi:hypothetical protein